MAIPWAPRPLQLCDPERCREAEPRFGQQGTLVETPVLVIGRPCTISVCGAARLRMRITFIGMACVDHIGHRMPDALSTLGVDVQHSADLDPRLEPGLSVILSRGDDRTILTQPGAIAALWARRVTDDLPMLQRLFMSPVALGKRRGPGARSATSCASQPASMLGLTQGLGRRGERYTP
jgi:hypothetical protein